MVHIDYYCFPTKTGDISPYMELEQYTNYREKLHYQLAQEDVLLSKKLGKLALFDLRNNTFVDENGNQIDLFGKKVFPRATIQESDLLMEYLEKVNADSITARSDYKNVENWFRLIPTRRLYKETTFGEVQKNLEVYEKEYGQSFFLKTIEKGFSGVCFIMSFNHDSNSTSSIECDSDFGVKKENEEKTKVKTKVLMDSSMHSVNMSIRGSDTAVLVYPAVKLLKDEYGRREWRAFVVENELWCLSRFADNVVPIEDYVYEKVRKKIKQFEGILPESYVVDFFEYDNNGETVFDVCECNPIIASGVFQNNDLVF